MLTLDRINELVSGINNHLEKLTGFSDSLKEIKTTLEELKKSQEKSYMWELEKMRHEFDQIKVELQKRGLPEISKYESSFRQTRDLINSEEWPRAIDPKLICLTDEMASQRAQAILDIIIGESLTSKSFLDFGCGEGHVIMQALDQNPKIALGYDLNRSKFKFDNDHFTSEFDMVVANGPFDIILLQDVLDHLEFENAVSVLIKLKSILTKNGRIYIRNHPWCSRHGTHLYTQFNKAFAHLAFDDTELCRMNGYANDHTIKLNNPIHTYRDWFSSAGFKIISEIPITKKLEKFFTKKSLSSDRIIAHWNGDETAMISNMEIEFVEYMIEPTNEQDII
jgi:2-polyprenyl-3-methyl-5-hydroxy-6-metoxy-1,4-benzoquinol methylase